MPPPSRFTNRIVRRLPPAEAALLAAQFEPVEFRVGDVLCESGGRIAFAVFPDSGVVSLIASTAEHEALELGLLGSEGMFGLPLAIGSDRSPLRAVVQGDGAGRRIGARSFRRILPECPALALRLHHYTHRLLSQVGQTALCNATHRIEARTARWMLALSDHLDSPTFVLTQDYLAAMLGVRRPAVSRAARSLLTGGLVRYSRGAVSIVDRAGLEAAACGCYRVLAAQFNRPSMSRSR